MEDKRPGIYTQPIDKLKSKVQNEYYYHSVNEESREKELSKDELIEKIRNLFKSPNFVYQIDTNIMLKNGENKRKKVIAYQNNYLITMDGERISINDIKDVN